MSPRATVLPDQHAAVRSSLPRRSRNLLAKIAVWLVVVVATTPEVSSQEPAAEPLSCGHTVAVRAHLASLAFGRQPMVTIAQDASLAPNLSFQTADGTWTSLADMRGRTLLINLWATWCAPCREEMPALDRLQARMGGSTFAVVAINVDQRLLDRPRQVLEQMAVSALVYHADPEAKVFADLKAIGRASGLPVSLLIDADGCELAFVNGPTAWDAKEAMVFVAAANGRRQR